MAIWYVCFTSIFYFLGGILKFISVYTEYFLKAPPTMTVMVMAWFIVHHEVLSVWLGGLYLLEFSVMVVVGNLL